MTVDKFLKQEGIEARRSFNSTEIFLYKGKDPVGCVPGSWYMDTCNAEDPVAATIALIKECLLKEHV